MKGKLPIRLFACLLAAAATIPAAARPQATARRAKAATPAEAPRISEIRNGTFTTRDGQRLRLSTDFGNVRILTDAAGGARFTVRIETDSRDPDAGKLLKQYSVTARNTSAGVVLSGQAPWHGFRGRLWVNYEVIIPRDYNVDVSTGAGNIELQDLDGRAVLITNGGNISAGRVGGREAAGARLETQGGHISVQDVAGELRASTQGGHINAANIQGDTYLHSGGGHIRVGGISGVAQLETGGGNIIVRRTGANVAATTGGGQIELGEAAGSIRARTGGGVIRVLRITGPTTLETGGGSILLTRVQSSVHALTGVGTITAWITPEGKLLGASQLESKQGDIVVFLPRELAITIEATIEMGADHRIEADPAMPVKISYASSPEGGRVLRGECTMNGGGEVLKLKAVAGNIRLKLADSAMQKKLNEQEMEQLRRRFELQELRLREQMLQLGHQMRSQLEQQTGEAIEQATREKTIEAAREAAGLGRMIELMMLGAIRVDEQTQQRKILQQVRPVYPEIARTAGLEGIVRLKLLISEDGAVREVKLISGERALGDAAIEAARQWRYRPTVVDDKPVNVYTTATVEFRLR